MATSRRKATLTPDEARLLHEEALVIDSQQPGATSGMLFNDNMKAALDEYVREGLTRAEIRARLRAMAVEEVQGSADARREYMGIWEKSGVNVASATYAGPIRASSGVASAVVPPGRKWSGASMCVPTCTSQSRRELLELSPFSSRLVHVRLTPTLPGQMGIPSSTATEMLISCGMFV